MGVDAPDKEGPWELYNLGTDRTETNDLAARYPDKVRKLAQVWTDRLAEFRELALQDLPGSR